MNFFNGPFFGGGFFATGSAASPAPKKKKGKATIIRYSDFASRDAYEEAIRAAIPIPRVYNDVPAPTEVIEDEDEILLMAITRILH